MSMILTCLRIVLLCLAGWGVAGAQEAPGRPTAEERLVEQVRHAESLHREDLVDDALARLFRIQPGHPEGLAAQFRLAMRRGDRDAAQGILDRLAAAAPGSKAHREAATLFRLETSQEVIEMLGRARLYAAAGRLGEARELYDRVFGGVYPTADLAAEYWQFRAREPGGRPGALANIRTALESHPEDAGLLAAAARLSLAEGLESDGLAYLHRLAGTQAGRAVAARMEFDHLSGQAVSEDTAARWRAYAERYRGHPLAEEAGERAAGQQALLDDPAWRAGQEGIALIKARRDTPGALARLRRAAAAYPRDPNILGALGLAWLRSGDRRQALRHFEAARENEAVVGGSAAWVSLIKSTRYWLLLEQAGEAVGREDWSRAESLYAQARRLEPGDVHALVKQADMASLRGQAEQALRLYRQALGMAPGSEAAVRGIRRTLDGMPPDVALERLGSLRLPDGSALAALRRRLELRLHVQSAERAQEAQDWPRAVESWSAAQALGLDDPWISHHLAVALRRQGADDETVMRAYGKHLSRHPDEAASRHAQALLLSAGGHGQAALDALAVIDPAQWTPAMHALAERLRAQLSIEAARPLREAGRIQEAIAALEAHPQSVPIRMQVAQWALDAGSPEKALANYGAILREAPDHADAYLGQARAWAARGQWPRVRAALERPPESLRHPDASQSRVMAELWTGLGDRARARRILDAARTASPRDPLVQRDLARLSAADEPRAALDLYAGAMRAAGLLPGDAGDPVDPAGLSRATRLEARDDWLARGLRRETAALYQDRNPVLTVMNDFWFRNDGTPGVSRLKADTTVARLEFPMDAGRLFLQADHVRMDAGTFDTGADGTHAQWFGSCRLGGRDGGGRMRSLPGCAGGLSQTARGTSLAVGYERGGFSADVGHSPFGFAVGNWLGGVSYRDKLGQVGWRLTLSRRPMSNSLLSFAGTEDPRTGIVWGGVVATGPSLGLSWDQGGSDGVWADLSHHRLTGLNVEDNRRTRLMAGYYRRLINEPHEVLSVGVNAMYWTYQKDLGEYTLGHGGYYSPQRYQSLSLPLRYARRGADWSFVVDGSISTSWSKSDGGSYYPLPGLIEAPLGALSAQGVSAAGALAESRFSPSSGRGTGYYLRLAAERRLSDHWVLGGAFEVQKSEDYSPNRAMLYLRYTLEPWRGDLPLPVSPIKAYSDFK